MQIQHLNKTNNRVALINFDRYIFDNEVFSHIEQYHELVYFNEGQEDQVKQIETNKVNNTVSQNGSTGTMKDGIWYYKTSLYRSGFIVYDKEAKAARFDIEYEALDDFSKFIIDNTIHELEDPTFKERSVCIEKLLRYARGRLLKNGFYITCSRCAGSGHYSYNQIDGTVCYKCMGLKSTLPKITKKWEKSVITFDFKGVITE